MDKQEILGELRYFSKKFPKEALLTIRNNKEEFIGDLLNSLEYAYLNAENLLHQDDVYYLIRLRLTRASYYASQMQSFTK